MRGTTRVSTSKIAGNKFLVQSATMHVVQKCVNERVMTLQSFPTPAILR